MSESLESLLREALFEICEVDNNYEGESGHSVSCPNCLGVPLPHSLVCRIETALCLVPTTTPLARQTCPGCGDVGYAFADGCDRCAEQREDDAREEAAMRRDYESDVRRGY